MYLTCPTCDNEFKIKPSHAYRRRFCSRTCKRPSKEQIDNLARILTKEKVKKVCEQCGNIFEIHQSTEMARGALFCSRECYLKSDFLKDQIESQTGTNSKGWKGKDISYRALHRWVERKRGKPNECEHCRIIITNNRFIHWANKSHEYKRDLDDWIRLCSKCHSKYDKL